MLSDSESESSSIADPDAIGVENDILNEQVEDDPFYSDDEAESSEYVSKCGNIKWSSIPWPNKNKSGSEGFGPKFNVDLSKIKTPMDAFLLFFDSSLIDLICRYTNAEGAHDSKFKPLEYDEFLAWIGVLYGAGKNHDSKTHIRELWSTDEVTSRVFYSAIMSRDRFDD